jgi:hypothetical protein
MTDTVSAFGATVCLTFYQMFPCSVEKQVENDVVPGRRVVLHHPNGKACPYQSSHSGGECDTSRDQALPLLSAQDREFRVNWRLVKSIASEYDSAKPIVSWRAQQDEMNRQGEANAQQDVENHIGAEVHRAIRSFRWHVKTSLFF